jgi:6-pyruvoyltetrahydropterin/6-carboxytetrahydropterin synthase
MTYRVVKRYGHDNGWSCCFRQYKATHSHCQFLHGYALAFELTFESDTLNEQDWVIDFGGLKWVKEWLQKTFDHHTIIAEDDPEIHLFWEMEDKGRIDITILPGVGCERFAEHIYDYVGRNLTQSTRLVSVKVQEHPGNSAIYEP